MIKTKPPWDESKPGPTLAKLITGEMGPAFGPPTKKELEEARKQITEARSLSMGLGAGEMTQMQWWLEQTRSREHLHRTNLDYFLTTKPKLLGGRKRQNKQIRIHRYGLVCALRDLGRFQEALDLASDAKGRSRSGFRQIAEQVMEWGMAAARPDDADCGCARRTHLVPTPGDRHLPGTTIELQRRNKIASLFSFRHGKVVDLWRCSVCGMLNAHALGPPESQVEKHRLRDLVARGRLVPGPDHADHVLLKR
jgi:hypothetical protein